MWGRATIIAILCVALVGQAHAVILQSLSGQNVWKHDVVRIWGPASLFPEAVKVRVYDGPLGIHIADDGSVTAAKLRLDGSIDNAATPKDGGLLTPQEISLLRESVFYSTSPKAVKLCCNPRHAFVFYGKGDKYLGYLDVCFQCSCAHIVPVAWPGPKWHWIKWNQAALAKIIEEHGLSTHPQDRPNK